MMPSMLSLKSKTGLIAKSFKMPTAGGSTSLPPVSSESKKPCLSELWPPKLELSVPADAWFPREIQVPGQEAAAKPEKTVSSWR